MEDQDATSSYKPIHILVTGASGYLGQHVLQKLLTTPPPDGVFYQITALCYSKSDMLRDALEKVLLAERIKAVRVESVDLSDADSVKKLLFSQWVTDDDDLQPKVDICLHLAAMSSPRACEQTPNIAKQVNIPVPFFELLKQQNAKLIALSTDQVFDGTLSSVGGQCYDEHSVAKPCNIYGQTKLDMEQYLQTNYKDSIILRSSIILGPKAPYIPAHDTFLHFIAGRDEPTTYFTNEIRSVVSTQHVCTTLQWMVDHYASSSPAPSGGVYHMGGPAAVSRYDMALAVLQHLKSNKQLAVQAKQTNPRSPLNISMSSQKLFELTKIEHIPVDLKGLVEYTL